MKITLEVHCDGCHCTGLKLPKESKRTRRARKAVRGPVKPAPAPMERTYKG